MNQFKPLYEHDCEACIYLGAHNSIDLYLCPHEIGGPTVIARYSSYPPDYTSGMCFARPDGNKNLYEARLRAIAKGLINEDDPLN